MSSLGGSLENSGLRRYVETTATRSLSLASPKMNGCDVLYRSLAITPSRNPSRAGYAFSILLKTVLRKSWPRVRLACVGERVSGFSTANLWKNRSSRQGANLSQKLTPTPLIGTRLIFSNTASAAKSRPLQSPSATARHVSPLHGGVSSGAFRVSPPARRDARSRAT